MPATTRSQSKLPAKLAPKVIKTAPTFVFQPRSLPAILEQQTKFAAEKEVENAKLRRDFEELEHKWDTLRHVDAMKTIEIHQADVALADLEDEIEFLTGQLRAKALKVADLQSQDEYQRDRIDQLERGLDGCQDDLNAAKIKCDELFLRNSTLELDNYALIADLQDQVEQVAAQGHTNTALASRLAAAEQRAQLLESDLRAHGDVRVKAELARLSELCAFMAE